ncbi:endonuclease domain-containing protein [Emcibacter sp.]|uniref:endonuclease domain-containing protein n=1 Tax=Emcibacter sp. TaxID=1979954 RepID=UPI003A9589DA
MSSPETFIFSDFHYDPQARLLKLSYGFDDGSEFVEEIRFEGAKADLTREEQQVLDSLFRQFHLAAGISYYKAWCPARMEVRTGPLSQPEADFFKKFYLMGLGEFAVENNLDLRERINFPVTADKAPVAANLKLPEMNAVPVGGGKDSIVSIEALRHGGRPQRLLAVNPGRPILEVMERSDIPDPILMRRKLDSRLFDLNDKGAMNGHVPITGILSFVMAAGSILYGYDHIVMSNEQSANEGNMIWNGLEINHQYSKSLEFERDFTSYLQTHIIKGLTYFSLLRPLSETGIACLFSRSSQYFDVFKSCNRNFHIDEGVRQYGWCCDCPKCRFVYLALAPFIGKEKLVEIFGRNMLDDAPQEAGFRELTGLQGHKPFECVGEIAECRLIIKSLSLQPDWQQSRLVPKLAAEIDEPGLEAKALEKEALRMSPNHQLPPAYKELLDDFTGA